MCVAKLQFFSVVSVRIELFFSLKSKSVNCAKKIASSTSRGVSHELEKGKTSVYVASDKSEMNMGN